MIRKFLIDNLFIKNGIKLFYIFILFFVSPVFSIDQIAWAHLELGAGNYGKEGHTKKALAKTILTKIDKISEKRNFLDDLEDETSSEYLPEDQYGILFWTLDELVRRYGDKGIFHVNDICSEYSNFAAEKLIEYANQRGYSSITITSVPGDYKFINPKETLYQHNLSLYTSVHLKNCEISFYHDEIDGSHYLASEKARRKARELLQTIANFSKEGLFFFIPYCDGFIPFKEREEFVEKEIFYQPTTIWKPYPYIFPDGKTLECGEPRVFHIKSKQGKENMDQSSANLKDNATMPAHNALLDSVMQGRMDTFQLASMYSPLQEADYEENLQNCLYAWGIDYACHNGVIEKDNNRIPTEEEIDRTIEYFSTKNLPFIWWTSANILEKKAFQFGGILTGIALDISHDIPSKQKISSNVKVKIVESEAELRSFTELAANAFAMNFQATEQWLMLNESVMNKGTQVHFIAYLNDIPVGTTTLSVSPTSAGIWNLATVSEYRNHGVGSALVHAALAEAKSRQYHQVMAILMPKGLAWGLFTKFGFKAVCEFSFFVYGASVEELEKG